MAVGTTFAAMMDFFVSDAKKAQNVLLNGVPDDVGARMPTPVASASSN